MGDDVPLLVEHLAAVSAGVSAAGAACVGSSHSVCLSLERLSDQVVFTSDGLRMLLTHYVVERRVSDFDEAVLVTDNPFSP